MTHIVMCVWCQFHGALLLFNIVIAASSISDFTHAQINRLRARASVHCILLLKDTPQTNR